MARVSDYYGNHSREKLDALYFLNLKEILLFNGANAPSPNYTFNFDFEQKENRFNDSGYIIVCGILWSILKKLI